MNLIRRRPETAALRHRHKSLELLQIEIDACHAPMLAKVALH